MRPDPDTELHRAVEGTRGELGVYVRSDGTDSPARFTIRGLLLRPAESPRDRSGEFVSDLIESIGSLDTLVGAVDR